MENKIKKEVYEGSGPAHLLSTTISTPNKQNVKKTRASNALKTSSQVLDNLYKSPL